MHKREWWDIKGGAAALHASESRVASCKLGEERQLGVFASKKSFVEFFDIFFFVVFLLSRSPPKVSADFYFHYLFWVVTCVVASGCGGGQQVCLVSTYLAGGRVG